jgi:hypothetical protein
MMCNGKGSCPILSSIVRARFFNQEESSEKDRQRRGRWCKAITVPPL